MKLSLRYFLPAGLAGRFALASAGLAAVAVLLVALASGWLIERQKALADEQLAARERQFHAANVSNLLQSLASRMAEMAGSSILATALVDSAGKETYLTPFLNGIRQVNGVPVQVLFTDFEGKAIAANAGAQFDEAQLAWLRRQLQHGTAAATVLPGARGPELVAYEPLRYSRTASPEGSVLYKVVLADIALDRGLSLRWGSPSAGPALRQPLALPPIFQPLQLRLSGGLAGPPAHAVVPQYGLIALIALLVFAAVWLAGSRLARLLTRDLSQLQAFSSQVMSAATVDQRAPEHGTAEVAGLASSINQMLERLHAQHEALRVEGEKLTELAAALQAADRRKDEFLAMLAHELRNPLAPISTGAELLRQGGADPAQVHRTSEIIARQVRHMTKLVDDLLDVSRVTRGLVMLEQTVLDLRTIVQAAADQVRPFCDGRRHALTVTLPPLPIAVQGDAARLVQIASNLLHNACKFTPDGGRISVSALEEDGMAVLRVADNGSGVPPAFLEEMFGLFTQGTRQPDRSQGGLGLGLALVKHLVELHGGTVEAHSDGPGRGTLMTVRLPLSADMLPATGPASEPGARGPGLEVLLVDDNVDAAETLAALLELEGHRVTALHHPEAALQHAGNNHHDIYILDIGLPGMDGNELARRLRAMPGKQSAVLVALTGYGQEVDRARSAAAGFDHHLVKPVDPDLLKQLLETRAHGAAA